MEQTPFLSKERRNKKGDKKGDKPRNQSRNQQEAENHDGTDFFFEHRKKRQEGRQAPEPKPKPGRTRKHWWNKDRF